MEWFKGKSTGNRFYMFLPSKTKGVPVILPIIQFYDMRRGQEKKDEKRGCQMGKSVEVANDIEGGRRTITGTPRSHRHGNGSKTQRCSSLWYLFNNSWVNHSQPHKILWAPWCSNFTSMSGWWFQPLWKILVNGKDYPIYIMENKQCLKPPTRCL